MAAAPATAAAVSEWPELLPVALARVQTFNDWGVLTRSPPTSRFARITSRTSRDSCETQPFSESLEWRGRDHGTEGRALCRRRPERLLPRRGPRGGRRRCGHPPRQQEGRPPRTPRPA